MKDLGKLALVEARAHGTPQLIIQGPAELDEVWGGRFLTHMAPVAKEEVMNLLEGMVMRDQMEEVWDVAKIEIAGLDLVTQQ